VDRKRIAAHRGFERERIVGCVGLDPSHWEHKKVAELSATVVKGVAQLFKYEVAHVFEPGGREKPPRQAWGRSPFSGPAGEAWGLAVAFVPWLIFRLYR